MGEKLLDGLPDPLEMSVEGLAELVDDICADYVWHRNDAYRRDLDRLEFSMRDDYEAIDNMLDSFRLTRDEAVALPLTGLEEVRDRMSDMLLSSMSPLCRSRRIEERLEVVSCRRRLADAALTGDLDGLPPEVAGELMDVRIDQSPAHIRALAHAAPRSAGRMAVSCCRCLANPDLDLDAYESVVASDAFAEWEATDALAAEVYLSSSGWRLDLERQLLPLRVREMELADPAAAADPATPWRLMLPLSDAWLHAPIEYVALDPHGARPLPYTAPLPDGAGSLRGRAAEFVWSCDGPVVSLVSPQRVPLLAVDPDGGVPPLPPADVAAVARRLWGEDPAFGSVAGDADLLWDECEREARASSSVALVEEPCACVGPRHMALA